MRHHIDPGPNYVDMWTGWQRRNATPQPLPYRWNEQKRHTGHDCELCTCRKSLCEAIQALTQNKVELRATYTCQGNVGDLDNLLFYNVDHEGKVFDTAIRFLQFERVRGLPPPCPAPLDFMPTAYAHYEVASPVEWNGDELAERHSGNCAVAALKSPADLWQLFRRNMAREDSVQHHGDFRVQLIVSAPVELELNLVDLTTDIILDAFVSACHHRTDGDTDLDEVVLALSQCYNWEPDEARRLLLLNGVLGHCLSVPKRNRRNKPCSLKWHPDDHATGSGHTGAP